MFSLKLVSRIYKNNFHYFSIQKTATYIYSLRPAPHATRPALRAASRFKSRKNWTTLCPVQKTEFKIGRMKHTYASHHYSYAPRRGSSGLYSKTFVAVEPRGLYVEMMVFASCSLSCVFIFALFSGVCVGAVLRFSCCCCYLVCILVIEWAWYFILALLFVILWLFCTFLCIIVSSIIKSFSSTKKKSTSTKSSAWCYGSFSPIETRKGLEAQYSFTVHKKYSIWEGKKASLKLSL
jgi:hypothetical protein